MRQFKEKTGQTGLNFGFGLWPKLFYSTFTFSHIFQRVLRGDSGRGNLSCSNYEWDWINKKKLSKCLQYPQLQLGMQQERKRAGREVKRRKENMHPMEISTALNLKGGNAIAPTTTITRESPTRRRATTITTRTTTTMRATKQNAICLFDPNCCEICCAAVCMLFSLLCPLPPSSC